MKCPFCGHTEDRVVDSRVGREGEFIRRRRECLKCHRRYTTYEYIEDVLPHVVKRDGRREPFDRQKLRGSILKSCEKRSVGVQAVDDVVVEIEAQLRQLDRHVRVQPFGGDPLERRQVVLGGRTGRLLFRHVLAQVVEARGPATLIQFGDCSDRVVQTIPRYEPMRQR